VARGIAVDDMHVDNLTYIECDNIFSVVYPVILIRAEETKGEKLVKVSEISYFT